MENKKLTMEDLPKDVVLKIKKHLSQDRRYVELTKQWAELGKKGFYVQAMQVKALIDKIETQFANEALVYWERQAVRMGNLMAEMEEEDQESLSVYTNSIIFLCDMVETIVMDCNQILHKYHPDHNLEVYNNLTEAGKLAREHVRFMSNCTDMVWQTTFADCADNLTEMVLNKTRSFMRKMKKKPKPTRVSL